MAIQLPSDPLSRRRFLSRLGLTVVSVGAAPSLLAACGGSGSSGSPSGSPLATPTSTGAPSGEISFLSWEGYDLPVDTMKAWLQSTGIEINATYVGNHDEIQAKIKAGGDSAGYDIISYYQGYKALYEQLQILAPIEESAVPNLSDQLPFFAGEEKNFWVDADGTRTGVPFTWALLGLTYNTAAVSELQNWSDLLDPKFKGRIATIDEPTGQFALGCSINKLDPAACPKDELKTVVDGIKPYIAQSKVVAASYGDLTALMVSGEIDAAYLGWTAMNSFAAAKGLTTVTTIVPSEGSYSSCDAFAIPPTTKNPTAALAFINEALDPQVQAQSAEYLVAGVTNRKAVPLLSKTISDIYPHGDLDSLFAQAPLFGNPPQESDEFVTASEWSDAWQQLKSGA